MRVAIWLGFWMSLNVQAAMIEGIGTPKVTIEGVPVFSEARVPSAPGKTLKLTGAGVRKKKIVLVKVDVYVAAHYLDPAVTWDAKNPMDAISKANVKVMELSFLRDVDSKKIREAFLSSLSTNKVDVESVAVKEVFGKLTFDIKDKQKLVLVGQGTGANESLSFETPTGRHTVKGPSVASNFWRIWFGIPDDGGLEDLKEKLVGQKDGE